MSRIKVVTLNKLIGKTEVNNVCNLGSGAGRRIKELVSTLNRVTSRDLKFSNLPGRDIDMPVDVLDISKFKKYIGWETNISLEDKAGLTLAWHQCRKRENAYV